MLKHGAGSCPVGRVPAAEIEAAVIEQLRVVFRQPEITMGTWKAARTEDADITEADAREALLQLDPLYVPAGCVPVQTAVSPSARDRSIRMLIACFRWPP